MNDNVPVHCKCGWTGWRRPAVIKSRPCPACDGPVTRWRKLEKQAAKVSDLSDFYRLGFDTPTPLESFIAERESTWSEPVKRLPNPYILRTYTGEVQIFRIPRHCLKRPTRRKRGARP